jgi:hypothetical protein
VCYGRIVIIIKVGLNCRGILRVLLTQQHEDYAVYVGILVENPHEVPKYQSAVGTVMQPLEYLDEDGEMRLNRI